MTEGRLECAPLLQYKDQANILACEAFVLKVASAGRPRERNLQVTDTWMETFEYCSF